MKGPTSKTTAVFGEPFGFLGLDALFPAGEYDVETEIEAPPVHLDPEAWKASVLVRLHPRHSDPGLERTLTVPLYVLDHALARDKLTGRDLVDFFIEEMLADPMARLVMTADRVSDSEIRHLYARSSQKAPAADRDTRNPGAVPAQPNAQDGTALQRWANDGGPARGTGDFLAKAPQVQ